MVQALNFYTVNVFSEDGIRGGNQLAVVTNAKELSADQMQAITRQFNYSESTFITDYSDDGAKVRIFVPEREIPFAGHPIVGTAFVVEKLWREIDGSRTEINLYLKEDTIAVNIDDETINKITMEQLLPKEHGIYEDVDTIVQLLGIEKADLLADSSLQIIAPSSIHFLFVPVNSLNVLSKLKPNFEGMKDSLPGNLFPHVFAVKDESTIRTRMFAPQAGITEDPATGSAQASLALALYRLGKLPLGGSFVTEQGYEMGRPSKLHNIVTVENNTLTSCLTTGNNYLVSKGTLWID